MNTQKYLERIGFSGEVKVDYESLRDLTLAHQYAVPMENLDIHLGIPIRLDVKQFYKKIVERRRGGGCYELNGLFATLLRDLGFQVDLLSSRVTRPQKIGPEFDHLALRVTVDGTAYLVDVGFGDGIREPMKMVAGACQHFDNREFVLVQRDGAYRLEIYQTEGGQREFDKGYILSLAPRFLSQFEAVRREHHNDPRSWFVRARVVTLATPSGRRTLLHDTFKVRENGQLTVTHVRDDNHYMAILRDQFGLHLPRVPRTKADRLSMRVLGTALLWQHRVNKLRTMANRAFSAPKALLATPASRRS